MAPAAAAVVVTVWCVGAGWSCRWSNGGGLDGRGGAIGARSVRVDGWVEPHVIETTAVVVVVARPLPWPAVQAAVAHTTHRQTHKHTHSRGVCRGIKAPAAFFFGARHDVGDDDDRPTQGA